MEVTFNGIGYMASINQKGVAVSRFGYTRSEAIARCWQDFCYYLWK